MKRTARVLRVCLMVGVCLAPCLHASQAKDPSTQLGMHVGGDRILADYHQILSYFRYLAAHSDRVEVQPFGTSTLGEEMVAVVVSSPANLARQDQIRAAAARLADPRGLTSTETAALIRETPFIWFVGCNLHSTEIASSQLAMEWVHDLATTKDPKRERWLRETVIVLVPSLNPDGQLMVTDWYRTHLGSEYEGSRMPRLYHPYVGHDNNRDWIMLTQKETRAVNRLLYGRWYPHLIIDLHQMVGTGPRMFVPPYADPISPRIHPLLWRNINLLGMTIAWRAEQAHRTGVVFGYWFDAHWPGSLNTTAWFKNIAGFWLEIASARVATPIYVNPTDLTARQKGLGQYATRSNFPSPWPGGVWRLRDIMDYQTIALDAVLETVAEQREAFLTDVVARAQSAVASAPAGSGYRVPLRQQATTSARRLLELLQDHGADVFVDAADNGWVPLAQPYAPLIEELLSPQQYPEVRLASGAEALRPYDVTAWTLPLMMGVSVERSATPPQGKLIRYSEWLRRPTGVRASLATGVVLPPSGVDRFTVVNCALRNGATVQWRTSKGDDPAADELSTAGDGAFVIPNGLPAACSALAQSLGVPLAPLPPGSGGVTVRSPRVGLYRPWAASTDEGWSRWILEQYGFAPESIDNVRIQADGGLDALDVLVLPDVPQATIKTGGGQSSPRSGLFPEPPSQFAGGIGPKGVEAVRRFVREGGTLVAWNAAVPFAVNELDLGVKAAASNEEESGFSSPGALARVTLRRGCPVAAGLPDELAVFVNTSSAGMTTAIAANGQPTWVVARYPEDTGQLGLSGQLRKPEALAGRAAAIAARHGKGKVLILAFRPLHRAQTHATFPIVFNALYWSTIR